MLRLSHTKHMSIEIFFRENESKKTKITYILHKKVTAEISQKHEKRMLRESGTHKRYREKLRITYLIILFGIAVIRR